MRKWYAESCENERIKVRKRYTEVRKWKGPEHSRATMTLFFQNKCIKKNCLDPHYVSEAWTGGSNLFSMLSADDTSMQRVKNKLRTNAGAPKASPIICSRWQFQILLLFQKYQIMRIVCLQKILMKYHTLFFWKLGKMSKKLSSAAVVIGALRVKNVDIVF